MTELIFLRHGETEWNRELRFQGQVDVPLNATGREQARRAGQALAQQAGRINAVVSSDLPRALQTAEIAASFMRLPIQAERALREQAFGLADGMCVAELQGNFPEVWNQWLRFDANYALPGQSESAVMFSGRVLSGLTELVRQYPEQCVLVVTHGGVLDMVYRAASGQPLSGPRVCSIPNAAINRVSARVERDAIRLSMLEWANDAHLAGMPAQPTYDQTRLLNASNPSSR